MEKRLLLGVGVMAILAIAFFAAFIATLLVRTSTDINGKWYSHLQTTTGRRQKRGEIQMDIKHNLQHNAPVFTI